MERDNSYLIDNQHAKGNQPNKTSFKKGNIPWNKDKKGIHLSLNSEFKKGQTGIHWVPIGTISIRIENRTKKSRQWIKVAEPNIWVEYAKFIWIKYNGNIPKGYLIHHIDYNSLNDSIDNLAMLTRKAHFEIHKISELGRKAIKIKKTIVK